MVATGCQLKKAAVDLAEYFAAGILFAINSVASDHNFYFTNSVAGVLEGG